MKEYITNRLLSKEREIDDIDIDIKNYFKHLTHVIV